MKKTLTAGLTALSLILVPATPVHADSRQDEINRTIISLLAIGAIGLAIKNNADNRSEAKNAATPRQSVSPAHDRRQSTTWERRTRHADPLPGRCFRRVETGRGEYQAVYAGRCLERRYRDANTLPRQCAVRMGGADGRRTGYDAGCLRDFGYRSDRRWN